MIYGLWNSLSLEQAWNWAIIFTSPHPLLLSPSSWICWAIQTLPSVWGACPARWALCWGKIHTHIHTHTHTHGFVHSGVSRGGGSWNTLQKRFWGMWTPGLKCRSGEVTVSAECVVTSPLGRAASSRQLPCWPCLCLSRQGLPPPRAESPCPWLKAKAEVRQTLEG